MNPDFKSNDFNDDLPKPAGYQSEINQELPEVVLNMAKPNEEIKINEEIKPVIDEELIPNISLDDVDLTKIDVPNDALSVELDEEPKKENEYPEIDGAAVFGFDEPKEIDADELLKTNPLKKVSLEKQAPPPTLPSDHEEITYIDPKTKKSSTLITILVVLIVLLGVIYGVYKVLSVGDANIKQKKEDEPSMETPVVQETKDSEKYESKIIKEKLTKIELFTKNNEALILYSTDDQNLLMSVGRKGRDLRDNAVSYPIKGFENIKVNNLYQIPSCDQEELLTYILMDDGKLYLIDSTQDLENIFTTIKGVNEENPLESVVLKTINILASNKIESFTSLVDTKEECGVSGIYVLTADTKEMRRIENRNNALTLGERYKGHVNFLKQTEVDYYINADKTFTDLRFNLLVDKNGQNLKFEKAIFGLGEIKELRSKYAFVGTDNRLYYTTPNSLYSFITKTKEVKEVTLLPTKTEGNDTENSIVNIEYVDGSKETLTIEQTDLQVVSIQELIDEPIN